MTIKIDGSSVVEQVIAGTTLLGIGAAGALAYDHRKKLKNVLSKARLRLKKKKR